MVRWWISIVGIPKMMIYDISSTYSTRFLIITTWHFKAESKTVFQYWWKTLHSTHFRRASHLRKKRIYLIAHLFSIELSCMSCFELEQSEHHEPIKKANPFLVYLNSCFGRSLGSYCCCTWKCFTHAPSWDKHGMWNLSLFLTLSNTQQPLALKLWDEVQNHFLNCDVVTCSRSWSSPPKMLSTISCNRVFIEYLVHSIRKHCQ